MRDFLKVVPAVTSNGNFHVAEFTAAIVSGE